jgi:hypothetical protein
MGWRIASMPEITVDLPSGRQVAVSVLIPDGRWGLLPCLPPHTARTQPVARIYRGENRLGSLTEDYYLIQDDPVDPGRWVLWLGDTGSQVDDDQARLYPVTCAPCRAFVSDGEAAAALLYAWLRTCAVDWEGLYSESTETAGGRLLDDELVRGILSAALGGTGLRDLAVKQEPGRAVAPQQEQARKAVRQKSARKRPPGRPRKGQ